MGFKKMNESEKEEYIIEKIANKVVELDMGTPAVFFLQTFKPLSFITGELAVFFLAPYLPLLDEKGFDFIDTFKKRENIEKLIKKVKKISKEKSKKEEKQEKYLWIKFKEKISSFLGKT